MDMYVNLLIKSSYLKASHQLSVSIFKNQVVNKLLSDVSEVGPFNIEVCRMACLLNQPQVVIPGTAFLEPNFESDVCS